VIGLEVESSDCHEAWTLLTALHAAGLKRELRSKPELAIVADDTT